MKSRKSTDFRSTANLSDMYFSIGFLLAVIVAFASPYLYANSTDNPALLTAITTVVAWIVFAGGGHLIDRRRKQRLGSEKRSD